MSFVDSLAGPIGTPQLNQDEAAAEATRAKEQADAYAKQQAEYEARAQAQADLAAAARNAEEQRAINDAMATSYQKYGQDKTFINPVTGRAEFFPKDYHLPTSAEVAQRVLPAPAASGTVADIAKWTPPSTPHVEDDLLGPVDKALADVGAGRGTEQPTAPSPSGPLRWSMGGKWYERAPGSSVDVPVKQVASPGGTTFEAISGAKPMSPETMDAIRHGIRAQGAFGGTPLDKGQAPEEFNAGYFGTKLPEVAADEPLSAGGVSTSSRPAFLQPSMIENPAQRLALSQIETGLREEQPVTDENLPPGAPPYLKSAVDIGKLLHLTHRQTADLALGAMRGGKNDQLAIDQAKVAAVTDAHLRDDEQIRKIDAHLQDPKLPKDQRASLLSQRAFFVDHKRITEAGLIPQAKQDKLTGFENLPPTGQ